MKTIKRTKIIRVGNMSCLQKLVAVYAIANAIGPVEKRRFLPQYVICGMFLSVLCVLTSDVGWFSPQATAEVYYLLATNPKLAETWLRVCYKMFDNLSYHGADKSRAGGVDFCVAQYLYSVLCKMEHCSNCMDPLCTTATSWFLPHRVLLPNQLNTEVVRYITSGVR